MARMVQLYVYDFTLPFDLNKDRNVIQKWLNSNCKRWIFQLEAGADDGYLHYQGRISLKKKHRLGGIIKSSKNVLEGVHWSPTSAACKNDTFYVTKEETRKNGPWSNKDVVLYVPRHISKIKEWYPWQQTVLDITEIRDDRHINVIYDPVGNNGKTTLAMWMMCHKKARMLPYCNDFKELMEMCYGTPNCPCYIIDLPRSINKSKLSGLFAGIEQIKNGWAFDRRYAFKEKFFDAPVIWVFSNAEINTRYLSVDRWIPWAINGGELVRLDSMEFKPPDVLDSQPPPMKRQRAGAFFDVSDYNNYVSD